MKTDFRLVTGQWQVLHFPKTPCCLVSKMASMMASMMALLTAWAVALPVTVFAQQTGNSDATFVVETVTGEAFTGTGVGITDGLVVLAGANAREFELDEIVEITTGVEPAKPRTEGQQILFVTGGGIRGTVQSVTATQLEFLLGKSPVSIGLEAVAGVIWTDSQDVRYLLANPSPEADQIVVEGSEGNVTVSGIFEGMNEATLSVQYQGQSRTVDRNKVQAILPARISVVTREDVAATVTMADGQSFRCQVLAMDERSIGVSLMKQEFRIPVDSVSTVSFASDRIQRLAELEPMEVSEEVLFAPARGWKRNKSVSGNPIRLREPSGGAGTRTFRNGLGMQARTRMVFANEKEFDRFAALVGIDRETEGRGDCVVSVRGDGIELWSARLQGDGPAVPVNIDIAGMRRIELIAEPGEQLDLSDHVDWADARFLRTR